MWTFLTTVILCGTTIYLWHRVEEPVIGRLRATAKAAEAALVPAIVPEPVKELTPEMDYMPPDLVQVAMLESEAWAREQTITAMLQARERTGNWAAVRARFIPNEVS